MLVGLNFDFSSLSCGTFQIVNPNVFRFSNELSVDPRVEYQSRLSQWLRRAEAFEQSHLRMGNARALVLFGVLAVAAVLCRTQASWGIALTLLLLGLVLTGIWHVRIEAARDAARRGIRFYQSGLERL